MHCILPFLSLMSHRLVDCATYRIILYYMVVVLYLNDQFKPLQVMVSLVISNLSGTDFETEKITNSFLPEFNLN